MAVKTNSAQPRDKYDYIAYISIIAIILSLFYVGFEVTGNAVHNDTAIVNVTISTTTAINFTTDFLNFGSGSVNTGTPNATIDSDNASSGGTWALTPTNLTLQNIGNTNVTLNLSAGKTAAQFIGGTSPAYQFKFSNNEAGSCVNASPTNTWTATSTAGVNICSNFLVTDSSDTINIGIKLTIPSDSLTGQQSDTITATATSI